MLPYLTTVDIYSQESTVQLLICTGKYKYVYTYCIYLCKYMNICILCVLFMYAQYAYIYIFT